MLNFILVTPLLAIIFIILFLLTSRTSSYQSTTSATSATYFNFQPIFFISFFLTIFNFFLTLILILTFDFNTSGFQFMDTFLGITIGIDAFSLWLIFLVNLISPLVLLSAYKNNNIFSNPSPQFSIDSSYSLYVIFILFINFFSILVFIILDIFLFYIAFEAVLIPMYFLIAFFGSRNKKILANYLFILYTLFGSLFLLAAIIFLFAISGTTDYLSLLSFSINPKYQYLLFIAFFIAFAVKLPIAPFHIWLPVVHTESPTGGSVILAAILLKLGTYGFIRFSIPLFPLAAKFFSPFIITLALISVFYAAISALSLIDLKQVIAYSSIVHMNLSLIGLFSNDPLGIIGAFFYSITHGLIASALFFLVGALYERFHTRTLKYFRGLVLFMPILVFLFFFFSIANLSFPSTPGFIPELFIYFSALNFSPFVLLLTTSVIILLPVYFLLTYHKISFGSLSPYISCLFSDLNSKELAIFSPLLIFSFLFGFFPNIILDSLLLPSLSLLY